MEACNTVPHEGVKSEDAFLKERAVEMEEHTAVTHTAAPPMLVAQDRLKVVVAAALRGTLERSQAAEAADASTMEELIGARTLVDALSNADSVELFDTTFERQAPIDKLSLAMLNNQCEESEAIQTPTDGGGTVHTMAEMDAIISPPSVDSLDGPPSNENKGLSDITFESLVCIDKQFPDMYPPSDNEELSDTACETPEPADKEVVDPCGEEATEQSALVCSTTFEDKQYVREAKMLGNFFEGSIRYELVHCEDGDTEVPPGAPSLPPSAEKAIDKCVEEPMEKNPRWLCLVGENWDPSGACDKDAELEKEMEPEK
ncbi:unnamed protein product [Prorocentrum cordatum]|uniref:Uncharacterized protein n=1 Tax=Prorocentrum cordatum TaxID=2364126 RepID=A0ABN9QZX6_9DINO|nr:unnamed protein product [Polarella glacialis]